MKKITFFLFLFIPLFCYGQNKSVITGSRSSSISAVKQVNTARQTENLPQQRPQPRPQQNNNFIKQPVSNSNYQREAYQAPAISQETHKVPVVQSPSINKEPKENLQQEKPISLNQGQVQKEKKPTPPVTTMPPARPGNYRVIYWTNFIDTQSPREQEWAAKVLDTKNLSLDGQGVNVAILDSGVKPHSQFDKANIEVLDITGQQDPFDFCGHGTAVAGIIVGQRGDNFKGVAPAVNLKSYKIADESGTTNNTYIVNALESILEYNRQNPKDKISIINISYGLEQDNYELKNKLAEAYTSGITIISASGNNGAQGLLYPARYDFVFAAGSINRDKTLSDFSNWGEGLDFILPGSGLKTLGLNNDYVWVKGTSFSSAYLTGVAALTTQAFKRKYNRLPSPQELYEVLQKISTPIKTIAPLKQGYGVPDASKIVSYI